MKRTTDGDSASESLTEISRLADEIHVLRQALDDLREELVWELRQLRTASQEARPPFRLTSMPVDPTAPDFAERVNALDASVFEPTDDFAAWIHRLTAAAPTEQLAAEDWIEDQEFTPGEVVEIEEAMRDWFAEYLVVVKQQDDWFLADDGEGQLFLLWSREDSCDLRLLTDSEQLEVARLTGIEVVVEECAEPSVMAAQDNHPTEVTRTAATESQRSLF